MAIQWKWSTTDWELIKVMVTEHQKIYFMSNQGIYIQLEKKPCLAQDSKDASTVFPVGNVLR